MSIQIHMFCQSKGESSSTPGVNAIGNIQLMAVLPGHLKLKEGESGPNAAVLSAPGSSASVQLSGLSDAAHAEIRGGRRYKVTIEEEV